MKLNERIDEIVSAKKINGATLQVLKTKELYESVIENQIGMDSRLPDLPSDLSESVFRGLEFNKDKMTSQAVVIHHDDKPIGIFSFVITPKHIYDSQNRYLKRVGDDITVIDFKSAIGEYLPDFMINPAWAKIQDEYRGKFTIHLFRLYESILKEIMASSPPSTGMEAIAQGQYWPGNMKEWNRFILSLPIGSIIPKDRIRFDMDIMGKPKRSSESTAKMAEHMHMEKISGISNYKTLGPVYFRLVA